ncbi:MAG: ATP-binding protein [Planctomycetales bacterium]|nr:ATP-binding protein [Planctomycetales bacterium]
MARPATSRARRHARPAAPAPAPRRAEESLLSAALDGLEEELLVVDREGVVRVWSRGLETRVAPRSEVLGKPLEEVLPRFAREELGVDWAARIRQEVLGAGETIVIPRYPQRTAKGELRLYDARVAPLLSQAGAVRGAVLSLRDVSAGAQLESETLRHAQTAGLATLGASVAHEVRNPLNSIAMNAQLVKEGLVASNEPAARELAETASLIEEETRRLNKVVTTFLTYARPPEMRLEPGDPNGAVRKALRLLEAEARNARIRVALDLGALPEVPLDREHLAQALYNVLLNGIQELEGGGLLHVSSRRVRDFVLIEVSDTGRGVPLAEREAIFELFHSRRPGGTGLGLPIAKRIVEEHGGRITVDEAPEGGARFSVYLPVEQAGRSRGPMGADGPVREAR